MRSSAQTNTFEYWIPGWSQFLLLRDLIHGDLSGGISRTFGGLGNYSQSSSELASQASQVLGEARSEFLADREHTEAREDSAYQRAVEDMRKAGLNPYTIGASGAPSSASSVGSDMISSKLQVLGYILDLKNLDARNRQITNQAIGSVLRSVK